MYFLLDTFYCNMRFLLLQVSKSKKVVDCLGNDPSEHKCVGFTVRTVSLTVYQSF